MLQKSNAHDDLVAVTFALPADHPNNPVSLVGDFNDWTPGINVLIQRPDGSMTTTVLLQMGTSAHFRYLGNDGAWFDDWNADDYDESGGIVRA